MIKSYRNTSLPVKGSLFALDFTLDELGRFGDNPLIRLIKDGVDFEEFRSSIERVVSCWRAQQKAKRLTRSQKQPIGGLFKEGQLAEDDPAKRSVSPSRAGRPAFDPVLMFRIAFYCAFSGKSDRAVAQEILDSATLQKFLKIAPGTQISPQAIWDYRECFVNSEIGESIFRLLPKNKGASSILSFRIGRIGKIVIRRLEIRRIVVCGKEKLSSQGPLRRENRGVDFRNQAGAMRKACGPNFLERPARIFFRRYAVAASP